MGCRIQLRTWEAVTISGLVWGAQEQVGECCVNGGLGKAPSLTPLLSALPAAPSRGWKHSELHPVASNAGPHSLLNYGSQPGLYGIMK